MKQINVNTYIKATENNKPDISSILDKRHRFCLVGRDIGTCALFLGIWLFLWFLVTERMDNLFFIISPILIADIGICSLIGASRNKKEEELLLKNDFVFKNGYVKEILDEKSWYIKPQIEFIDGETLELSVIGLSVEKDDKVTVVLANQEKAKWVLPRITLQK